MNVHVYSLNIIDNIVAKDEIDHYVQFLLLPQCLQNLSAVGKGQKELNNLHVVTHVNMDLDPSG